MKRQVEETKENIDLREPKERVSKRQKDEEPKESENTGGSSSSQDNTIPKESEDLEAESAKNKSIPNPKGPSKQEREDHEQTHYPYRSWCKHCVKGRGREDRHNRKAKEDEKPEIPTIAMDYCFMGKDDKKALTIIVIKDSNSKAMKAFITQKGSGDGEIVKKIQKLIDDQWGRRKIIFKADKEPAIKELRDRVRDARTDETVVEHSAKGDSQSNSIAEKAVQDFEGLMRTWMSVLQDKYKADIPAEHPIVAFLVEYIGEMYNSTHIGSDGKTPYKRIKGRDSTKNLIPFGEKVLYKRDKPTGKKNKLEEKFREGIWAGVIGTSKEHIVLTQTGPKTARTIRRVENDGKYDLELLSKVVGRPLVDVEEDHESDSEVDKGTLVECQVKEREEGHQEEVQELKRRWKITKEDIETYGITPGCLGCRTIKAGLPRQNHSERCRQRIEDEIKNTEEGRAKIERSDSRINEAIAKQIQHEDRESELKKAMSDKAHLQQAAPTVTANTQAQVVNKTSEALVNPTDERNIVTSKEKRRNENQDEEKQTEKRRRLGRLSKGKQWLHWKDEMEEALHEEERRISAFPSQSPRGPIMTLYVQDDHEEYFIDDVYGKVLNPDKVRKARLEELRYFKTMGVYEKCNIKECLVNTGKNPIKTRWIDTNKTNDPFDENYRSRLVAKEYKTSEKPELYSGTPPVELIRMLISKIADSQLDKQR